MGSEELFLAKIKPLKNKHIRNVVQLQLLATQNYYQNWKIKRVEKKKVENHKRNREQNTLKK